MNHCTKRLLCVLFLLAIVLTCLPFQLSSSAAGSGTGYLKAEDVEYVTVNGYIANWGYRGETCSFLSSYADAFYTDDYSFDTMSQLAGGSGMTDAPESQLYATLQKLMTDRHTTQTSYGDTRYQYMYTDCQLGDSSTILSFYSGNPISSTWDSGKTWNREHVWPASKSLSGRPSNPSKGEGADIMMLRPTAKTENGSRGNKAYGLSSGYYVPEASVRGDCARILLYTYVRWGNTTNMWGSSGVIENLDILLQWMEEDPVDTWEMGRNDAVQSITGTRNVFVDYPEYAWLLFGQEIPAGMETPSQMAKTGCVHSYEDTVTAPTCTTAGYTTHTCQLCGDSYTDSQTAATGQHTYSQWIVTKEPTTKAEGVQVRNCTVCNAQQTRPIEMLPDSGIPTPVIICAAVVIVVGGSLAAYLLIKRKKK